MIVVRKNSGGSIHIDVLEAKGFKEVYHTVFEQFYPNGIPKEEARQLIRDLNRALE